MLLQSVLEALDKWMEVVEQCLERQDYVVVNTSVKGAAMFSFNWVGVHKIDLCKSGFLVF